MTQEEKQLLLKDLCARLIHGVIYHRNDGANIELREIDIKTGTLNYTDNIVVRECKPYLRPMSSMTEEEKDELSVEQGKDESIFLNIIEHSQMGDESLLGTGIPHHAEDWANKNHFDYRGLIPMGLALEAPTDMYKS